VPRGAVNSNPQLRESANGLSMNEHQPRRRTGPNWRIAALPVGLQAVVVTDSVIERAEVIALLFNVSDIAVTLTKIERLLGEDNGEEETDED
jgi:hypothetical protein